MEISKVRVKLIGSSGDRLRAFCSITLDDDFVIRDLKIIDGPAGPFVAMPSRKLAHRCPSCSHKNHLRARYCNSCGASLPQNLVKTDRHGRDKLHADIAHPINSACRERIQEQVIKAYKEELALAAEPGYVPKSLDDDDEGEADVFPEDYEPPLEDRGPASQASTVPRREPHRPEPETQTDPVDRGRDDQPADEPADADKSDGFGKGIL